MFQEGIQSFQTKRIQYLQPLKSIHYFLLENKGLSESLEVYIDLQFQEAIWEPVRYISSSSSSLVGTYYYLQACHLWVGDSLKSTF